MQKQNTVIEKHYLEEMTHFIDETHQDKNFFIDAFPFTYKALNLFSNTMPITINFFDHKSILFWG